MSSSATFTNLANLESCTIMGTIIHLKKESLRIQTSIRIGHDHKHGACPDKTRRETEASGMTVTLPVQQSPLSTRFPSNLNAT